MSVDVISGVVKRVSGNQYVVRTVERSYQRGAVEVMVAPEMVRRFHIVEGAGVVGESERKKGRTKLVSIESIGGMKPEDFGERPRFVDLVAINPEQRFDLGGCGQESMRIVDLISPIGKGTRQLIVSPPKAGKTVLLEQLVKAIRHCSAQTKTIVLLVDERPEEVTVFRRAVPGAEVAASTIDNKTAEHIELVELMLAHVQIELECGREVVLLIDSLTRVARAFNNQVSRRRGPRGHTMSGGLEAGVLEVPRRLFGLARNIENGGSLTVIATCLIKTGSRMDQLIFEEFKGTGNSEIVLDRSLAEARIFPAIDIAASGTRKEAVLYGEDDMRGLATLRRVLSSYSNREGIEAMLKLLKKYPDNKVFLESMGAGMSNI